MDTARHSYPSAFDISTRDTYEPANRRHSNQIRRSSHFHEDMSSLSPQQRKSSSSNQTEHTSPRTSTCTSRIRLPHRDSVLEPDSPSVHPSMKLHHPHPKPHLPPPLRLTKYAVLDLNTHTALYTITRNAVHLPPPISSKPLLTITRAATGAAVGSILFHALRPSFIELSLSTASGTGTAKMTHDGPFCKTRWRVPSLLDVGDEKEERRVWVWCQAREKGEWEMREGSKKGEVVARIGIERFGDVVMRVEREGLGEGEVDEILVGAFAVVEAWSRGRSVGDEWGEVDG